MIRLGLDSFSLRWQGWDPFQFLDYASGLGLDNVQFSTRGDLASHEEGYLCSVADYAAARGLTIEIGMGSIDRHAASFRPEWGSGEEQLSAMIRAAAIIGSPIVRCFLGSQDERTGAIPLSEHIAECVRVLQAVTPLAQERGIRIGIENHGGVDLLAREMIGLVEAAGTATVGVCLDTGNPPYAAEDPLLAVELLAPYTISTHIRDTRVWMTPDGAQAQWVPLGQGNLDLDRVLAILGEHAPDAPLNLEVITGVAPQELPYLTPDSGFWDRYPAMPARDLARFIAYAQRGGNAASDQDGNAASDQDGNAAPLDQLTMPRGVWQPPAGQADALLAQQRRHFEESVHHFRAVVNRES